MKWECRVDSMWTNVANIIELVHSPFAFWIYISIFYIFCFSEIINVIIVEPNEQIDKNASV